MVVTGDETLASCSREMDQCCCTEDTLHAIYPAARSAATRNITRSWCRAPLGFQIDVTYHQVDACYITSTAVVVVSYSARTAVRPLYFLLHPPPVYIADDIFAPDVVLLLLLFLLQAAVCRYVVVFVRFTTTCALSSFLSYFEGSTGTTAVQDT